MTQDRCATPKDTPKDTPRVTSKTPTMGQTDPDHDLLQSIITDIAAMTDPLPGPTNEAIASIVTQSQVQYLRNRVTKLETENHGLRDDVAALRDENNILRFENDLLTQETIKSKPQTASPSTPRMLSFDLINLSPVGPFTLSSQEVKGNKEPTVKASMADTLKKTESGWNTGPEDTTPDREDKDDPEIQRNTSTAQFAAGRISKESLPLTEAHDQNTCLFLTDLLPNTSYRALLQAVAVLRPGRIKETEIKGGNIATVTFFTREAAERLHAALRKDHSRHPGPLLCNVSASWSSESVPPDEPNGRTRVLGVEGHPDVVNVANVLAAVRWQGYDPKVEIIILTPPETYQRHDSGWTGPLQQVICRFRGVLDAVRVRGILARAFPPQWQVSFQYLPDPCE